MFNIHKPCIRQCCLNEDDICMGCFRTLDDMRVWHSSTDEEKHHMLKTASIRKVQFKKEKAQHPAS